MEIKIGVKRLIKICALIGLYFINNVCSVCNWPSEFQSTQWHDSSRGIVTFQVTSMDGWGFSPTSGTILTSWNCVSVSTYATDGRIILISANPFDFFSTSYYAYLCIQVTKVTDYSYRYYIDQVVQGNLNNERIFIYPVQSLTDAGTICSSSGATGGEYQSWVQVGNEQNAKLNCPWSILGQYGYTHTFSNGQSSCDVTTPELDICTNTQEMSFDYSACSTKVAYSVSNTVWCVDNVPVGNTNYVMLFNGNDADTDIDDVTVYRFTCMAVADSMTTASVSPKYCQRGQVADDFPLSTSGQQLGALLSFSAPTTTCPTCPELSAPTYGNVDVTTFGSVTSALYTCDTNYTLWGTATRTCQDTDTWTDSAPACNCASPAVPENGTITVNADGSVAVYTCSKGFTLSGLSVRNCQSATATWEDADPTCTPCSSFATIAGQASTLSTTGTVTSASFICGAGYTLSGSKSLTCASDGTWNASQPSCVTCNFLTNPASGTLVLLSDGAVSTANYACASVYTLQGDSIRTCQLNGTWDGSAPECTCNKPSTPSNGAVDANGQVATYTCNVNYSLNGDSTRTCQTDGTGWSGANPDCSQCNTLATVTGGDYTLSTTGTLTSATYTCQVGYSLDGTRTITCLNDGSWGSASATCVECQSLSDPTSGTVSLSSSGTRTSATYACASEYNLNGNTIRLCNSDGTWTLAEPTCTCKSPTSPQNGNVTDNGVTATYVCDQGYSLSGLSTRVCATDGTGWSGSDPTCSTCATLSSPTGGTVDIGTDGYNTQASITCSSGYTLNGVSPITCRNDGTWDFTAPTCAKCPDLVAPDSGSMTITSDGVSTTVTFSCQSGYYLNGAFTITCGTDGSWSNSVPTCNCNFPDTPSNGGMSVSDTSDGPTASYSCLIGYSLNGPSERVCMSDGTGWEGVEPECTVCQTVSTPTSGTFSLDSNDTHTAVTFSCVVGSTLEGDSEQVCLSDGSWESVAPTCVPCPTLSDPSSGSVTLSSSGSSTIATFACVTGYTLSSSSTLTCSSSGSWDLTSPYCICKSPSLISNGELTITDNLSTARYECYTGYVMVGPDTRYCQDDGTGWSGISPACNSEANIGASTEGDDTSWNVHIAVVVVAIVLLLCLVIALAAFIHMVLRLRQNNSRVSSATSRVSKETADPEDERVPEVISETDPGGPMAPILKKYQNGSQRPSSTSSVVFARDVAPTPLKPSLTNNANSKANQLPPIEHVMKSKRSRKPIANLSPIRKTGKRRVGTEQRPKTPLKDRIREVGIDRVRTPELLSTAEFNYIQPQYSYELEAPSDTNTVSRLGRKGK